jgi:hypothetical protein
METSFGRPSAAPEGFLWIVTQSKREGAKAVRNLFASSGSAPSGQAGGAAPGTLGRRAPPGHASMAPMGVVEEAVEERLEGGRPGRLRAVLAAIGIGVAVAVLAYRLLRSGDDSDD